MKEHGILMSAPMVRAYLAGLKSQTRRIRALGEINANPDAWKFAGFELKKDAMVARFERAIKTTLWEEKLIKPPYGWIGDSLWFKETYEIICRAAEPYCECETEEDMERNHYVEYRADTGNSYPGEWPEDEAKGNDEAPKWKSSMFMPRKHARVVTSILKVRVERLQSITPTDVLAEGIKRGEDGSWLGPLAGVPGFPWGRADLAYAALWNSLNEKRGMGWDLDPWVWVYEFNPCVVLASPGLILSKGHI